MGPPCLPGAGVSRALSLTVECVAAFQPHLMTWDRASKTVSFLGYSYINTT